MKAFGLIGSMRGEKSNTLYIVNKLFDKLKLKTNEKIEVELITLNEVNIRKCTGCTLCFNNGFCKFDDSDDMKLIKKSMIDADIIIFGSPVYAHNVSGGTKNVIDRLSYWFYIYKLIGKVGITISTSNSNGNKFVDEYLNKIMEYLGVSLIDNISLPLALISSEEIEAKLDNTIEKLAGFINNKSLIKSSNLQAQTFNIYKQMFINKDYNGFQRDYWLKNKYFNYESYDELLQAVIESK